MNHYWPGCQPLDPHWRTCHPAVVDAVQTAECQPSDSWALHSLARELLVHIAQTATPAAETTNAWKQRQHCITAIIAQWSCRMPVRQPTQTTSLSKLVSLATYNTFSFIITLTLSFTDFSTTLHDHFQIIFFADLHIYTLHEKMYLFTQ